MMTESKARNLVELPGAQSEETRSCELVPQTAGKAVVVEVDREVCDLGTAVSQLSAVIKDIAPQDLSFEYSENHSASRSTRHLRLRAYRKIG
jgi:hypothetical protein